MRIVPYIAIKVRCTTQWKIVSVKLNYSNDSWWMFWSSILMEYQEYFTIVRIFLFCCLMLFDLAQQNRLFIKENQTREIAKWKNGKWHFWRDNFVIPYKKLIALLGFLKRVFLGANLYIIWKIKMRNESISFLVYT